MRFIIAWLRQQSHCLVSFHRPARLRGVYSGPETNGRAVDHVVLGCADCGRVFYENPKTPMGGEPMHLSKAWFDKLKPVDEEE